MQNRTSLSFVILTFFFAPLTFGQLSINTTVINGTCRSNGEIQITVNGGSGDYTFSLTNSCGHSIPPPRTTPTFSSLLPCDDYYVVVFDEETGEEARDTVSVTTSYQDMEASIVLQGCDLVIEVNGGSPPYSFSSSDEGRNGSFETTGKVLPRTRNDSIWVRVIDQCGVTTEIAEPADYNPITAIYDSQSSEGVQFSTKGGLAPFVYTLTSSEGTFTNSDGFFPWEQIGCDPKISVDDFCDTPPKTQSADIDILIKDYCTRFFDGFAQIEVSSGRAPFTYYAFGDTSTTGIFNNLPVNFPVYNFTIEDRCGVKEDIEVTQYRFRFAPATNACNDDNLIFEVDRNCTGPLQLPIELTCTSCSGTPSITIESFSENQVEFSGSTPGNWAFSMEDDCGEQINCRDTVMLELIPGCDSIVATPINLFFCNSGLNDRRIIEDSDIFFTLYDSEGNVIESGNRTGVFNNLSNGSYLVEANGNCGILEAEVTLENAQSFDPGISYYVDFYQGGNSCSVSYDISILKNQGPYVLKGGPDGTYNEAFNNYGQDNCKYYRIYNLKPGKYELISTSYCGTFEINLPEIDLNRLDSVEVIANCPSDGVIDVAGQLWSSSEWRTWFSDQGVEPIYYLSDDFYYVDGKRFYQNRITGLSPGETYEIKYIPGLDSFSINTTFDDKCAGDQLTFDIAPYEFPDVDVFGNLICDEETATTLEVAISGSAPPFIMENLSSCDGDQLLPFNESYERGDTLNFPNTPIGQYCISIRDFCFEGEELQFDVGYYTDTPSVNYQCDSTVDLALRYIPFDINWSDEMGVFDQGRRATIDLPKEDITLKAEIDLKRCLIERDFTIESVPIFDTVSIFPMQDTINICQGDNVTLRASTNAEEVFWEGFGETDQILVNDTDSFVAYVYSEFGCITTDTSFVNVVDVNPVIDAPAGICAGTEATLSIERVYPSIQWSNGDSAVQFTSINAPGSYSVIVTDEYGCEGASIVQVEDWQLPSFEINGDTLICPEASTPISTSLSYESYAWNTGETTRNIDANAGAYRVTVTDRNGCQNAESFLIEERPVVMASITGDTTVCFGDEAFLNFRLQGVQNDSRVSLLANGELIDIGTIREGTSNFPVFLEESSEILLSEVLLDDYPCTVQLDGVVDLTVRELPSPTIKNPEGICRGDTVALIVETEFPDITWSEGSSGTSQINTSIPGPYSVTVEDELGCIGSDTINLMDWLIPEFNITGDTLICPGTTEILGTSQNYSRYLWSNNTSGNTVSVQAGNHSVTVTDQNGCTNSKSITLTERPEVTASLSGDTTVCLGDTAKLSFNLFGLDSSATAFLRSNSNQLGGWEVTGDGDLLEIVPTDDSPILFSEVLLDGYPCPVLLDGVANIIVRELPNPAIIAPSGICRGDSVTIYIEQDFHFFEWSTGAIGESSQLIKSPGTYRILAVDDLGCEGRDSVNISDWQLPDVRITGDTMICYDTSTPLSTEVLYKDYKWSNGAQSPTTIVKAGVYDVTVTDQNNCMNSAAIRIFECPPLLLDIGQDIKIELGDEVTIQPSSNVMGNFLHTWRANDEVLEGEAFNLEQYVPTKNTVLELSIIDDNDCIASDSIFIRVDRRLKVFAPNAFSPNGDGINDFFYLQSEEGHVRKIKSFRIFNRFGNLLFEQKNIHPNDKNLGWNGLQGNNEEAPYSNQVFIWMAEIELIDGSTHLMKGDLTIVR